MRRIPLSVVALLGLLVSACAATALDPTTPPSSQGGEASVPADGSACDEAFAAIVAIGATQDTIEDLYPTVRACESVVEWVGGVAANPGAIETRYGDVRVFLGNLCGSLTAAGLAGTELCRQVHASCGTEPVWETTLACASRVAVVTMATARWGQLSRERGVLRRTVHNGRIGARVAAASNLLARPRPMNHHSGGR